MAFQTCSSCPTPGKCRAAGKCLNKTSDSKKMGKKRSGKGSLDRPINRERTTSDPSGKYNA